MHRRADRRCGAPAALAAVLLLVAALRLGAQEPADSSDLGRAYDLEGAAKYREAATLFKRALRAAPGASALLGLERSYAELRTSDSLLPVLDSLIARQPREPLYRTVQLRTLQVLRRDEQLRSAFDAWVRAVPRDPTPYREYARVLLALGRPALADSVVEASRRALGSGRALALETAQLRAAQGQWVSSTHAWREALDHAAYLSDAASYALAPSPAAVRDSIRSILLADASLGVRRALAQLELGWGRPAVAWVTLRSVTPDTAAATAWVDFGDRAMAEERFDLARQAFQAALQVRRAPDVALRVADAALRGNTPADALAALPLDDPMADSAQRVREYLPRHVAALAALGRPADAESLVRRYDAQLAPGEQVRLARDIAAAWVRVGDLTRARAALPSGPDGDSSETAGWLALYAGRLPEARALLTSARDPSPELALALGIVARTRGDDGRAIGAGFLALARADTVTAIARFLDAADRHGEVAAPLRLAAARLRASRGDVAGAEALWGDVVARSPASPEAAEAELEWARGLRRRGELAAAVAHLEHLILGAPTSALVPQARRELDLARAAAPVRP